MSAETFQAGTTIFEAGDEGNRAYVLESGRVVLCSSSDSTDAPIAEIRPGEIFGEMSLIEERPRQFSARAVVDSTVTSLTRTEFEQFLFQDPERCRKYLKSLFEQLRTMASRLHGAEPQSAASNLATAVPTVVIYPLTADAAKSVPNEGFTIPFFPFRIGRASEANEAEALGLNDMWLLDTVPFSISRNHAVIDVTSTGEVQVSDRGSNLGTLVNQTRIGGRLAKSTIGLKDGENKVTFGGMKSPFEYRILVSPANSGRS